MTGPSDRDQPKQDQQSCQNKNVRKSHLKTLIDPLRRFIGGHNDQTKDQQRQQKSDEQFPENLFFHALNSRRYATRPVL